MCGCIYYLLLTYLGQGSLTRVCGWATPTRPTHCLQSYRRTLTLPLSLSLSLSLTLTLTLTSTPTLTCLLTELQAYTPGLDDQHVVGHMFVDRPDAFALDYNSSLFQSLQGDGVGAPVAVHPAGGGRAVRNSVTGSSPLVLHFNGGAYRMFKRPLARTPPPWQCLSFAPVPLYWARLAALGDSTLSGREVVPLGA